MTLPRLRKISVDDTVPDGSLPPELLAEAARRLGWLGLLYAGAYTLAHFGPPVMLALGGGVSPATTAQHVIALVAIFMGLAVFFLSRGSWLGPERLLEAGLVFNVVGALGIAVNEFWRGFFIGPRPFLGIPWEAAWILLFPLVVPNRPGRVLLASLLAASMGPLTVLLAGRAAGTSYTGPLVEFISYFLFTSYVCAVVAWVLAKIVMRYGARLKQARDIGSYELLQKLGEGGMGEVWMARHRLLARPAAIKLIRADLLGADERSRATLVRRFEREARDTAALGSPHTVDIYDFGVAEGGSFYYVMELLEGESLEAHVQRFGPLEVARAVYLLRQVCHSLSEAHARGLVHRDIKPANIFVCRLGHDDDFVKVLDFGLVKHAEASSAGTLISMEGLPTGTPAYMPPELAMGAQPIDARADIYAFGCVAYWLLTGQPVFKAETSMATMLAHVREAPTPPSLRAGRDLPPALEALVMACLAKAPGERPATIDHVSDRLAESVPIDSWSRPHARRWWDERGGVPRAIRPDQDPESGSHSPERASRVTVSR